MYVHCSGSNYGEEQTVISISLNKENTLAQPHHQEQQEVEEQEEGEEKEEDEEEGEIAEKDEDGDSFTTAASSLSSVNVCKICHCGEEVNYRKQTLISLGK